MVQMRTHTCGELRLCDAGKQVKLVGFMENVRAVSASLAFSCYWDDIKTLGLALWIDLAVIGLNAGVFADALRDYLLLRGQI